MSIIDYLRDFNSPQAGQKRRQFIENMFDFEEYVPPNLRAPTQFVLDANPVTGMGNAVTESRVAFDPTRSADERKRAGLNMMLEVGVAAAPAVLGRMGYLTPPVALAETFAAPTPTSEGIRDATTGLLSDLQYGARSIAEGNPRGVLEVFQSGGQPTALSAATPVENAMPIRATQYSPTYEAALDLPQEKGTFDQMKALLLKGGAKEQELEWSGFNRKFANSKITKDQIIDHFIAHGPDFRVVSDSAVGRTWSATNQQADDVFDNIYEQMFERFELNRSRGGREFARYNQPDQMFISHDPINTYLEDEGYVRRNSSSDATINRFRTYNVEDGLTVGEIAEKYGAEKIDSQDYSEAEIAEFADGMGVDYDRMLLQFLSGDAYLFEGNVYMDGLDFLKANEPDIYNQFKEGFREELRFAYEQDPPAFINNILTNEAPPFGLGTMGRGDFYPDGGGRVAFDEQSTQFSQYFPDGADNYTENKFYFDPATNEILPESIGRAGHFVDRDRLLITSRTGDYNINTGLTGNDKDNVRYIGEVQSDVAQRITNLNNAFNKMSDTEFFSPRMQRQFGYENLKATYDGEGARAQNFEETALMPKLTQSMIEERRLRSFSRLGDGENEMLPVWRYKDLSSAFREQLLYNSGVVPTRAGYASRIPSEMISGHLDKEYARILLDNVVAHNFLLNQRGVPNTYMKPDPHKPTYDYAQYDIDFNEMSHKDILDIVYQRRAPKNTDEIEAFEQMEEDFKMAAPEAIRYYFDLGNRNLAEQEESLEMYLPMLADYIKENDKLYFEYLDDLADDTVLSLSEPLRDAFDNVDFDLLEQYGNEVREAHVDTIKEANRYAAARPDVVNVGEDGKPLSFPSGPSMAREKDWAPFVLRDAIIRAVNDDVDVVAIPYSKKSIARVGGMPVEELKQGTINYYRKNIQNYLSDIFKKVDKNFSKQIKEDIAKGEFRLDNDYETAVGFRLTKEMKDRIRAKGLPTFGVAGGIGLTNFMLQDDERQQPTSLLGGI